MLLQQVAALRRALQVEELVDGEVLEDVVHDDDVHGALRAALVGEARLVQAKEAANQTIDVVFHVHEVVAEH